MNAGGHEVMMHVAQHADNLSGQRFIQDFYGFIHVAFITFGYGAVFHFANGALAYLLYISNKMRHKVPRRGGIIAVTELRLRVSKTGCLVMLASTPARKGWARKPKWKQLSRKGL
jgi:hypothetical protein